MAKSGRPYKVHEELTHIRRAVENEDDAVIKRIVLKHGIDALDGEKRTALIWASYFGKTGILNWLIDNGADLNKQDRTGFTALHYCGQEQNTKITKILLLNGADTNIKDEHGNSSLWTALLNARGNFELVKLLRAYGADPTPKNIYGRSPDDMALTIYKKEINELIK